MRRLLVGRSYLVVLKWQWTILWNAGCVCCPLPCRQHPRGCIFVMIWCSFDRLALGTETSGFEIVFELLSAIQLFSLPEGLHRICNSWRLSPCCCWLRQPKAAIPRQRNLAKGRSLLLMSCEFSCRWLAILIVLIVCQNWSPAWPSHSRCLLD